MNKNIAVALCIAAIAVVITLAGVARKPAAVISKSKVWVCWASPSESALEKCRSKGCDGAGIKAWHKDKKVARSTALSHCHKEYETKACAIDYCERH